MSRYADGTSVPVERSRGELETLLAKHGASQRMIATDDGAGRAVVRFRLAERMIQLEVRVARLKFLPEHRDVHQPKAPRGWNGWSLQARRDWIAEHHAQAEREAWRRLLLVVKAKLELIADQFSTVEREFLADILLPNGQTVGDALSPQLAESYRTAVMPSLLPPAPSDDEY